LKPSRAYLHLTNPKYVNELADKVRSATFNDVKGSAKEKHTALLGPPVVEFDPFGRIPSSKTRKDLRQGTLDQDQEFIDFLESLTNPIPKVATVDQEDEAGAKAKEKVTTTPLIQYLKEKKANRGKEGSTSSKGPKHNRQDSKDGKPSSSTEKKAALKPTTVSSPDQRSAQAIKVENAARDAVKVLNKQATNANKPLVTPVPASPASIPPKEAVAAPLAEKKRERGNASVAARILQRDLGINGRGGRGGRRAAPTTPARPESEKAQPPTIPSTSAKELTTNSQPAPTVNLPIPSQTPTTISDNLESEHAKPTSALPPTGPSASRNLPRTPPQPRGNNAAPAPLRTPSVSPTATQAFLKHANPSQGITEPLLEIAFAPFGAVAKVEIDKKKGFAYVDFAEPEGLQNAIKASPVKIAQGQVVVLELKTRPALQARNLRGGAPGPIRGSQQNLTGGRGGVSTAPVVVVRGGAGPPTGPRGGRGGARGRGSVGRGGMVGHNTSTTKPAQAAESVPEQAVVSATTAKSSSEINTSPQEP